MKTVCNSKSTKAFLLNPSACREGKVCALALAQSVIHYLHDDYDVETMEHCSATRCALTYGQCGRAAVSLPWAALVGPPNHLLHLTNHATATSSSCPCRTHSGKDLHRHPRPYVHSPFRTFFVAHSCFVPRYHASARRYQRKNSLLVCFQHGRKNSLPVEVLVVLALFHE